MSVRFPGVLSSLLRALVVALPAVATGCATFDGEARDAERRGDLRGASDWYARHIDEHGAQARAGLERCIRKLLSSKCDDAGAAQADARIALVHYQAALDAIEMGREYGIVLALEPEDQVGFERAAAAVAASVEQAAASGAWVEAAAALDSLPAVAAQRLGARRCSEIHYRAGAALAAEGSWRSAHGHFGRAGQFEDAPARCAECLQNGSLLVRVEPGAAECPADPAFVAALSTQLTDRLSSDLREDDGFVAVAGPGSELGRSFGRTLRVRVVIAAVETADAPVRAQRGWAWSGGFARDAEGRITGLDGLEAVPFEEVDGVRRVELRAALEIDGARTPLEPVRAEEAVHTVLGSGSALYLMRMDPTPLLRDHFDDLQKVPDFAVSALLATVLDGLASVTGSRVLVEGALRGAGRGRTEQELLAVCSADVVQQAARRVGSAMP